MPSTPGTSLTTAWWHLGEAMGRFSQDKHIAKTESLKLIYCFFLRKAFGRFKKMRCSCSCFKGEDLFVPKEKTHYIFTCLETLHPIPPWNASPFFVRPFDTHAHTHTEVFGWTDVLVSVTDTGSGGLRLAPWHRETGSGGATLQVVHCSGPDPFEHFSKWLFQDKVFTIHNMKTESLTRTLNQW